MSTAEPTKAARANISVVSSAKDSTKENSTGRVSTGIVEVDSLIEGGFPPGKCYLVVGDPGAGKSIFCMHFVWSGLMNGEKVVYVPVDEKPSEVVENAASLGWDFRKYVNGGQLLMLDTTPALGSGGNAASGAREVDVAKIVADLASYVKRADANRLVIDPLGPLVTSRDLTRSSREQARLLLRAVQDHIGVTTLLTVNAVSDGAAKEWEDYPSNGIFILRLRPNQRSFVRTLLIYKMRSTALDLTERHFAIVKGKGIVLEEAVAEQASPRPVVTEAVEAPAPAKPAPSSEASFFKEWSGH
jgi:KaiC/GvpD/RAD55 family RecA-like ATPase